MPNCELIVYACPLGPLAEQLAEYAAATRAAFGPNAAHAYMPHCTLTGFFHDEAASIAIYAAALEAALARARPTQPEPVLAILQMELRPEFHGLLLEGPWLKGVIADFTETVRSPTRSDDLRRKSWLHLSLAYGFPPEQHEPLAHYARELVDIRAPVCWELCLYERHANGSWTGHARWPLDQSYNFATEHTEDSETLL